MDEVVAAEGVVFQRGSFQLDPMSFALYGDSGIVGLFGQNGAGKTTLLRGLAGLSPLSSGTIRRRPGHQRPVFLPDAPYLYDFLRVGESLALMERYFADFSQDRARAILDFLGLDRRKRVRELSKGMNEQLSIALMLARQNDVYLFDEPLAAVDPVTRDQLVRLIRKFLPEGAVTLLSTHLIFGLQDLFDSYMVIHDGALVAQGRVQDDERAGLEDIVKGAILGV